MITATPKNWIRLLRDLKPGDTMVIHPRAHLGYKHIEEVLCALGYCKGPPGQYTHTFCRLSDHGTTLAIQRL